MLFNKTPDQINAFKTAKMLVIEKHKFIYFKIEV